MTLQKKGSRFTNLCTTIAIKRPIGYQMGLAFALVSGAIEGLAGANCGTFSVAYHLLASLLDRSQVIVQV